MNEALSFGVFLLSARLPHRPIFLDKPQNQTVEVGGTARLVCTILSDMQPHLQWLRHYQVNGSWTNDKDVPYVQVIKVICSENDVGQTGENEGLLSNDKSA